MFQEEYLWLDYIMEIIFFFPHSIDASDYV